MEFTCLIFPLTKNICRTCLSEFDSRDPTMFMNIQDLIEHEMNKIKLIDILVFLNCLEVRLIYHYISIYILLKIYRN